MLKRLLLIALLAIPAVAQAQINPLTIRWVGFLPTTCNPDRKNDKLVYLYLTDGANDPGLYECSATDTYTVISGGGGVTDGAKGDVTVSGGGTVWRVTTPLNLGDDTYVTPFNSLTSPLSTRVFYAGWNPRRTVPTAEGWAASEFSYQLTLDNQSSKNIINQILAIDVQGPSADTSVIGQSIDLFSNSSSPTGTSSKLYGIASSVDIGGPWAESYGGQFSAFVGSVGAAGLGKVTGIYAQAGAAHHTGAASAFAGDFEVSSATGAAATVPLAVGVRSKLRLNSGATFTDYRAISISDWTTPSGGSIENAVGLYIDNSMAGGTFGTVSRYAIRSLATADSLFDGPVRGPISAYNSGTWNGSSKFATEDAVRDQIESMLLGGLDITGGGTIGNMPVFTGATQIGDAPLRYASNTFTGYHTDSSTDVFKLTFTGAVAAGSGEFRVGNSTTVENYLHVDGANARIKLATRDARIGDTEGFGNGTQINVSDTANSISYSGSSTNLTLSEGSVSYYLTNRTNTAGGTTGAQSINKPYGSVNFAAGAQSLVVTNSKSDANSIIFLTAQTNDATCRDFSVTRAAGSFTINANQACTAETRVGFQVSN